jgi:hypothetical protein
VRNWEQLSAVLVKAVQEQQATIVDLRQQLSTLQTRLDQVSSMPASQPTAPNDEQLRELQLRVLQLEGALGELLGH